MPDHDAEGSPLTLGVFRMFMHERDGRIDAQLGRIESLIAPIPPKIEKIETHLEHLNSKTATALAGVEAVRGLQTVTEGEIQEALETARNIQEHGCNRAGEHVASPQTSNADNIPTDAKWYIKIVGNSQVQRGLILLIVSLLFLGMLYDWQPGLFRILTPWVK